MNKADDRMMPETQRLEHKECADCANHRYPIDTPEHTRIAWLYISHEHNAASHEAQEVLQIKERIEAAAQQFGIIISDARPRSGHGGHQ